jgi:hypothetical protein
VLSPTVAAGAHGHRASVAVVTTQERDHAVPQGVQGGVPRSAPVGKARLKLDAHGLGDVLAVVARTRELAPSTHQEQGRRSGRLVRRSLAQ